MAVVANAVTAVIAQVHPAGAGSRGLRLAAEITARIFATNTMAVGAAARRQAAMKTIGFLSFGHWTPSPHSETRSASDALLQSIDLAVAAEELGADGAYFRVHHFARQ